MTTLPHSLQTEGRPDQADGDSSADHDRRRQALTLIPAASQLAIVQFFERGNELEEAEQLVEGLGESGFKLSGIRLLIAARQGTAGHMREDIMFSHRCTDAISAAVKSSASGPIEVSPVYERRIKIDGWLPYGTPGREMPEELTGYDISESAAAASAGTSEKYAELLGSLTDRSNRGLATGIGLIKTYRNTGLILLTSSRDADAFALAAVESSGHVATETINGGVVFTDFSHLESVS